MSRGYVSPHRGTPKWCLKMFFIQRWGTMCAQYGVTRLLLQPVQSGISGYRAFRFATHRESEKFPGVHVGTGHASNVNPTSLRDRCPSQFKRQCNAGLPCTFYLFSFYFSIGKRSNWCGTKSRFDAQLFVFAVYRYSLRLINSVRAGSMFVGVKMMCHRR